MHNKHGRLLDQIGLYMNHTYCISANPGVYNVTTGQTETTRVIIQAPQSWSWIQGVTRSSSDFLCVMMNVTQRFMIVM